MTLLNKSETMLESISEDPIGTGILAFRDLPEIMRAHVTGNEALDFGCGAGRSSRLLKECGFHMTGIDISREMIEEAQSKDKGSQYLLTKPGDFSILRGKEFNLILLSFVLMELSNKPQIIDTLTQLSGLLAKNGKMIVIAASDHLYFSDWLSMKTAFPENNLAGSGDIVRVFLKDYGLEIKDHYWKEKDCENFFSESGLSLEAKFAPIGKLQDNKAWLDELIKPPFIIYVLRNKKEFQHAQNERKS